MADSGTGYTSGGYTGGGLGGSYGPGYGMTFTERLKNSLGRNVTVYVGQESTPVMGKLHAVGSDYVEVHRMNNMNNTINEAMLIPMHAIMAVSVPM
ncbi:hypothetical protein SPSYN_00563 [Sporotomaculum syntrophicum]|uniref:Uncharacterized protein n=1 Tax=Sporotomaculum syntrophicum TaxID=182264 RepID=A0A9D2WR43_9FIRM|nr:hypothetical protein [Sporotomaculum syntrophicum]KAF1085834.1 hypothetical protein SPSYN_00563 [Sporotomaculum syntrophicum]